MASHTILLSGKDWEFRMQGESEWKQATVPGCIHSDLFKNKLISNPFFGLNEKKLQWIERKDWEYKRNFRLGNELMDYKVCRLVLEGVDTYADFFLNDTLILSTDNMFIPYTIDVHDYLQKGENELRVSIKSPYNQGLALYDTMDYILPVSNDGGEKSVSPHTRKTSYMYGCEWAPRLLTSGIYKNISLEFHNDACISHLQYEILSLNDKRAELRINCTLEVFDFKEYQFFLYLDNKEISSLKLKDTGKTAEILKDLIIEKPEYWWPRGYGPQKLYEITATLKSGEKVLDNQHINLGLRTVELQTLKDKEGKSFRFRINGRDIFIRGANIIPVEYFPSEITPQKYEELVDNAISVNMNMIRSCGEGIYEKDYFYELCDKHGILVWQDFMFTSGMYPSDDKFLSNIEKEISFQVLRLKKHPSIVIWCGNNEILNGFHTREWKQILGKKSDEALQSYKKVFLDLIPGILERYDPSRPYWPSSPSSGTLDAPALNSGDYHFRDLVKNVKPYTVYTSKVGRFMSEYGFIAYPEIRTIESFLLQPDWDIQSEAMKEHECWETGSELVEKNISWFYPSPSNFPQFLYLSQLLQADAIAYAIENHRKAKPYCAGTLYRQMNDCWPSASCSGIDYYGRWKAMHYRLKTVFRDILLSASQDDGYLKIHAVSDLPEEKRLRLSLRIKDFSGKIVAEHNSMENFYIDRAHLVYEQKLSEFITEDEKRYCVLDMNVFDGNHLLSNNLYYFVKPQNLRLENPGISIHLEKKFNKVFLFLNAERLAKNLYLVNVKSDGFFSENYFDLMPGEDKVVVFESYRHRDYLLSDFRMMSLWNCIK